MIPSRRRLRERLVPDEDLRVVTYGRLVDDSIRGTVAIGLTDRRIVCLSPDDDLVDVDYATISTIRSFSRSRLTFEGIDSRLLTVGFGGLAVLFAGLAVALTVSEWNGSAASPTLATLVALTTGAALAALFGGRFLAWIRSTGLASWVRARWAGAAGGARRVARGYGSARSLCGERGRRTYWWLRRRMHGLGRWSGNRFRWGYWWCRRRLASLSWWVVDRLRWLASGCRRGVDACYGQYATRTDRPLEPLAVHLGTVRRSAPVESLTRGIRAGLRAARRVIRSGAFALRTAYSTARTVRVRERFRTVLGVLRAGRRSLSRTVRVPTVSRPRLGTPTRTAAPSRSRQGRRRRRRWPGLLAGTIAVGSFAALVAVDPDPAVALALAAAVGCLAVVAYATRLENDCTGVQFSREHETELSIHTIDGDTVRLLLDPETDLDAELSRSAARVARTTPETATEPAAAE